MSEKEFEIVIASKNQGKIAEFSRILKPVGIQIVSNRQIPDVEESGKTFEENALLKAHAIS